MFELNSKYGEVKIFAETIEQEAISQIISIANSPLGEDAHVRIMPDAHAGKGCVIGTTMKYEGKICPNIVGVDIGCGVLAIPFKEEIDLEKFDEVCHKVLVSGRAAREEAIIPEYQEDLYSRLLCWDNLKNHDWIYKSLGTLGGGNHFVELNKGDNYNWLVVHTGSRNLGKQVADFYQLRTQEHWAEVDNEDRFELINHLKSIGEEYRIQEELKKIARHNPSELDYLEGAAAQDYLHDMKICQEWARKNRQVLSFELMKLMGWSAADTVIHSIHNYIDLTNNIIRKGAISAQRGETCIIPLNMRDGSLICVGKGNEDWNCSAPHGAGRIMSRAKAKKEITLADFQHSMEGIYSSTICVGTIDEAPFAYKDMEEIMIVIEPTVDIIERIVPIYNFKAVE